MKPLDMVYLLGMTSYLAMWKKGTVTAIHKKGNSYELGNKLHTALKAQGNYIASYSVACWYAVTCHISCTYVNMVNTTCMKAQGNHVY